MREVGTIPDEKDAQRLADYLLTLGITTRLDPKPDGCVVWVHREERVDEGRRELEAFLQAPRDPRYDEADQAARALRRKAEKEERQHEKNSISLSGRWDHRPAGRQPLTLLLIAVSILVGLYSRLGDDTGRIRDLFLASSRVVMVDIPADPEVEGGPAVVRRPTIVWEGLSGLRRGEVWRLVTPIFIHFGPLHLLFNMMWLYDLGGLIEMRKGSLSLAALVLAAAVASNLGEHAFAHQVGYGDGYVGGMSGVVYALLGYVWMKSRYDPAGGMLLGARTLQYMMIWLVVCMAGVIGPVANAAHVVGLVVGVLIGFAPHASREVRRWL